MVPIQQIPLESWALFSVIISILLAIDLGVAQRRAHTPSLKESLGWSVIWTAAAAIFNLFVYISVGFSAAIDFGTAYIIERSLSVDNLFVFAVIFRYFGVEVMYQHRVLFWGILGAIVARATFIIAGIRLLETFSIATYIFGAVLIYGGYRLLKSGEGELTDPSNNLVVKIARRVLPLQPKLQGSHFFVKNKGKLLATPLFLALLTVESTDIIFALDSVPAVLSITTALFIAYTSNIFAILGLRALYFLIIPALLKLRYLSAGLALLLIYLGTQFLVSSIVDIPSLFTLIVVGSVLGLTVAASLLRPTTMTNT